MSTYKVLQDIEAEDKFLGPLTLKQFIFAAIAIVSAYLSVIFLTKGIWVLVFPMVPVIVVTGFLAFPWGRDQPTEVWLLAKIRFMFKPRKRIWDQAGIQELVKITAPVVEGPAYTSDNLSQNEVNSRLRALANTIDSRGWAVKGVDPSSAAQLINNSSDRLVAASTLPQATPLIDDSGVVDIFDSPQAAQLTSQIAASSQQYKQTVVGQVQDNIARGGQPAPANNFWFMNQSDNTAPGMASFGTQMAAPAVDDTALPQNMRRAVTQDADDAQLLNRIHDTQSRSHQTFRNHKSISPRGTQPAENQRASSVTAAPDPVTIELARNNDRNVESLARETNRLHPPLDDDEVVVSLH